MVIHLYEMKRARASLLCKDLGVVGCTTIADDKQQTPSTKASMFTDLHNRCNVCVVTWSESMMAYGGQVPTADFRYVAPRQALSDPSRLFLHRSANRFDLAVTGCKTYVEAVEGQ